jgi:hypothetical protein
MPLLQAHFQPAYFIALVRNGYAVAEGIRRRSNLEQQSNSEYEEEYPIELCAKQWKACNLQLQQHWSRLERKHMIYYEDLTSNPQGAINEITDFLGIPQLDERVLEQKWSLQGRNDPIRNMNSESFERLTRPDFDRIEKVVGDQLRRHGYAPNPDVA